MDAKRRIRLFDRSFEPRLVDSGEVDELRLPVGHVVQQQNATGLRYPPLATKNHRRQGTRQRLLEVSENHPLTIELDAHVTKVLFDGTRAIGVEYLKGRKLYKASEHAPA